MGEYTKAEPLFLQARDIGKKAFGEQHFVYAINLNNLAHLYQSTGEYAKAEPLFLQALAIQKNALGEQHFVYAKATAAF